MTSGAAIVVTRAIPAPGLELLAAAAPTWVSPHDRPLEREELFAAAAGARALVTLVHDRVDAQLLDAAGDGLQVVANVAVGVDNIDLAACAAAGVTVTNTPGVLTEATADLAFALILMTTRRLGEGERLVRAGTPWSWNMFMLLGTGLQGKTLGIVGLGQIGSAVARRARAFGMEISYTGRRAADSGLEAELDARRLTLEQLLESADVVSLHCPLTPETRQLIDAAALARMKPEAFLVNTTRGPVVEEAALAAALRDGRLAGAGLDVYEREPAVHPELLTLDNVVLLPHLGSATVETRTAMAVLAARNTVAVLSGGEPLTPVSLPPIPAKPTAAAPQSSASAPH
jgi:lactate dehydrogenase-like 2-hydroxyacid dehydrogenase